MRLLAITIDVMNYDIFFSLRPLHQRGFRIRREPWARSGAGLFMRTGYTNSNPWMSAMWFVSL